MAFSKIAAENLGGSALPAVSGASLTGISSGLVYINGVTITSSTASATIDSCFSSTYRNYMIFWDCTGTEQRDLMFRFRTSGSDDDSNGYNWGASGIDKDASSETSYGNAQTAIQVGHGQYSNTDVDNPTSHGIFEVINPSSTTHNKILQMQFTTYNSNGDIRSYSGGGYYLRQPAVDGIKFYYASTGNVFNATVKVYGLVNS